MTDDITRSPDDDEVLLRVSGFGFSYPGSDPVLENVSLSLRRGRCVGLLGPNGTGKSTLLGAISSSIAGHVVGTVDRPEDLGYATQEVALYRHMTTRENLVHSSRLTTKQWQVGQLVDDAVELYGLQAIENTKVHRLSGGQKRLAHIANAFVQQPSVRLLDEPTTALDFETRQHLVKVVSSWQGEGIATLVTAHYPEDVEDLCTDLVVLVDGTSRSLGPLATYLARSAPVSDLAWLQDGHVRRASLDPNVRTLDGLVDAAASLGVRSDQWLHAVLVRDASLRDILVRDPSLRNSVEEVER